MYVCIYLRKARVGQAGYGGGDTLHAAPHKSHARSRRPFAIKDAAAAALAATDERCHQRGTPGPESAQAAAAGPYRRHLLASARMMTTRCGVQYISSISFICILGVCGR